MSPWKDDLQKKQLVYKPDSVLKHTETSSAKAI